MPPPQVERDDYYYLGSHYFLNTPGYYKQCAEWSREEPCDTGAAPRSLVEIPRWTADEKRPYCDAWWLGGETDKGLIDVLYDHATSNFKGNLDVTDSLAALGRRVTGDENAIKDAVIKNMLAKNPPQELPTYGASRQDSALVAAGVAALGAFGNPSGTVDKLSSLYLDIYFAKRLMYALQPVIVMLVVLLLPLILVLTGYSFSTLFTVTALVWALQMWPAMFVIANSIESAVFEAGLATVDFKALFEGQGLNRIIIGYLMFALPIIMCVGLVWLTMSAGTRMGGGMDQYFQGGGAGAGAAGSAGAGLGKGGGQGLRKVGSKIGNRFGGGGK